MDKKKKAMEEEDYGDYVTRCICDFKHDDGYMIACDECGVWQHIECMQVDPKNLPENYLCEECEPRSVDRRRARQIQIKKREGLSEMDDSREGRSSEGKSSSSSLLSSIQLSKKKRKKGKIAERQTDPSKRSRRDPPPPVPSLKKPKKKSGSTKPTTRPRLNSSTGSIQSLLNAASLLEGGAEGRRQGRKTSGLWNANHSPWCDEYENVEESRSGEQLKRVLLERLSQLKSEAVVYSQQEYNRAGRVDGEQSCSVVEVGRRRKGVVADISIPEDELVVEYKGVFRLRSELLTELSTKSLWKSSPCPFVYQYDKMADLDVCLDARSEGGVARFIRRSCAPNAEVRHFFVEDELHFGVYALSVLSPQEEVTLAFDFQHDKCDYTIECACDQVKTACPVAMAIQSKPKGVATEDTSAGRGRQRSFSHLMDEDSNSSWTSTGSVSKRKRGGARTTTPLSPKQLSSRPTSREESSDSEVDGERRRKSLTREERKTEQVWKMFEKMEASAQRKRQQLVSEGSADSTEPLTSPLLTRHMPHTSTIREKQTPSGGSRRAQLLQSGGKLRLSSVSSGDPLSPCELPEPFSPPTTPAQVHPSTPSLHTPSVFMPTVDANPYLHPKYLLEEFVLPLKKAFLRKWEYHRLNKEDVPDRYSFWAGGELPCHPYTAELTRPRVRGSLKHRWLRQLYSEGGLSDKENRETPPLPRKKEFLKRWQESEVNREFISMATSVADNQHTQPGHDIPAGVEGVCSRRSSPLFDELSDGEEFEMPRRHRRMSHKVKESVTGEAPPTNQSTPPPSSHPTHGSHNSPTSHSPPEHSPHSSLPVSMEATNSKTMSQTVDQVSLCSDVSDELVSEPRPQTSESHSHTPPPPSQLPMSPISPTGPITPPTLQESTPSPLTAVRVSDISSDIEGSLCTSEHDPHTPPTRTDKPHTSTESYTAAPEEVGSVVCEGVSVVGEVEAVKAAAALAPPLSPSAKTPIKRKINLSEYRNRARKPVERNPSSEKPSTPPLLSHHTPSLPTLRTTSTHYTVQPIPSLLPTTSPIVMTMGFPPGVAMETNVQLTTGSVSNVAMTTSTATIPMTTGGSLPQFEPVSPDDGDHTPPLGVLEGPGVVAMGGAIINRELPIPPPQQSVMVPEGGLMLPGYQPLRPQVWPVEQTHDPRRGPMMPGEHQFVEVRPPTLLAHPHYPHMMGMQGRGFLHPHHHPPRQFLPRHPRPGGGYYQ